MTERLLDRRPGEPLSDYAQRMLDLIQVAKSMVEFEMGGGIDFDVAMSELQEIIDGDGKSLAVREVRKALDFARPYFPRLEMPHYPSDNDLIEAAMEMVRQHERGDAMRQLYEEHEHLLKNIEGFATEDTEIPPEYRWESGGEPPPVVEYELQRAPGETDDEWEERKQLFDDLKRNDGRIVIGVEQLSESMIERLRKQAVEFPDAEIEIVGGTDTYAGIAEMMIASASLGEILAAHPDADIGEVMRWHADKHGDDLSNTHAAREWLRQKRR